MGYYSDVAIALRRKDYDTLLECAEAFVRQRGLVTNDGATGTFDPDYSPTGTLFDMDFLIRYPKVQLAYDIDGEPTLVILYWEDVKWYTSYYEVGFIMDWLTRVEHQFVRSGEEQDDMEIENTFDDGSEPISVEIKFHFETVGD